MTFQEASAEYWRTWPGIAQRLDVLGSDFVFRTVNGAIQAIGADNNVYGFEWLADRGYPTQPCDRCDAQDKRFYRLGQFMQAPPLHPNCRCTLRIVTKED